MIFRIVLLLCFIPGVVLLARTLDARSRALRYIIFICFYLILLASLVWPSIFDSLASSWGVNSGLDLIVSVVVVSLLTFAGYVVNRFRHLFHRQSLLVQELALVKRALEDRSGGIGKETDR